MDFQTIDLTIVGVEGEILSFTAPENAFFVEVFMTSASNLRLVVVDESITKSSNRRIILLRGTSQTHEELGGLLGRIDFGVAQVPSQLPNTNVFYVFELEMLKKNPFV
jgi:hypothetical protein